MKLAVFLLLKPDHKQIGMVKGYYALVQNQAFQKFSGKGYVIKDLLTSVCGPFIILYVLKPFI